MSDQTMDVPAELPLLVGPGGGEAERLLLIGAPQAGRVVVREWSGDNWSAAATSRTEDALAMLRWVEAQGAAGRTLNQSVYGVRLWLRGEGVAPSTR